MCISPVSWAGPYRAAELLPPATLLLAEQQVNRPAAADMLARLAAVIEEVTVLAACLFQSIGKDWQALESPLLVDALSKSAHSGSDPGRINSQRTERVAYYFSHQ